MANKITLGGDSRIGSGKKMKVETSHFNRSTHNLSRKWTSSMASGTIVPYLKELMLPGDTFDVTNHCEVLTHPTLGPLFDSYKVQIDMYFVAFRLYNNKLMLNEQEQGLNMTEVLLPTLALISYNNPTGVADPDNIQINPSHLLAYLGIRGLGHASVALSEEQKITRKYNAIPYLAYYDIYYYYYANKQETVGYIIHNDMTGINTDITDIMFYRIVNVTPPSGSNEYHLTEADTQNSTQVIHINTNAQLIVTCTDLEEFDTDRIQLWIGGSGGQYRTADEIFNTKTWDVDNNQIIWSNPKEEWTVEESEVPVGYYTFDRDFGEPNLIEPRLQQFPLSDITDMRKKIFKSDTGTVTLVGDNTAITENGVYGYSIYLDETSNPKKDAKLNNQDGLCVKTHQADVNNAWVNTEWIDGTNGINEVTAITVTDDKVLVNEINVKQRIYKMLMNIGVTGGTVNDWQDSVYDHHRPTLMWQPMYVGGLSKELVFDQVVSNASGEIDGVPQPLGTLAGRGTMTAKNKGGKTIVRADEHGYLIGVISLTPRIGYSQGNDWDMLLTNIDQTHKPDMDQIGFQDLITDQMAWFDTEIDVSGTYIPPTFKKAGKQPAWINYMTSTNKVLGNFAIQTEEMFMVLTRRYENNTIAEKATIKDLTTYIDPVKYNHIFADTRRDAQNFWVQIYTEIIARRKMSAKLMPRV